MASHPTTDHVTIVRHFSGLRDIHAQLKEKICASQVGKRIWGKIEQQQHITIMRLLLFLPRVTLSSAIPCRACIHTKWNDSV